VMNQSDKEQPFHLWMNGYGAATVSQPHSISTYIIP
jgi:glucosylceramidase